MERNYAFTSKVNAFVDGPTNATYYTPTPNTHCKTHHHFAHTDRLSRLTRATILSAVARLYWIARFGTHARYALMALTCAMTGWGMRIRPLPLVLQSPMPGDPHYDLSPNSRHCATHQACKT